MFIPTYSGQSNRARAERLYGGTFPSGAWAMIIPSIPFLALRFGVSAGGAAFSPLVGGYWANASNPAAPFSLYAPLLYALGNVASRRRQRDAGT
jgi:hypothetical protein